MSRLHLASAENVQLSIVAVGRNDDYGGDFLSCCRCFLYQLCSQLGAQAVSSEIIMVEWNPLPEKPPLHSQVSPATVPKNVTLRFIEVPAAIHDTFENSRQIALFEYMAKNVGVRRARGCQILATNPDLLFPDRLIDFCCREALEPSGYYRAERVDFDGEIGVQNEPRENLAVAERTVTRRFGFHAQPCEAIASGGQPFLAASGDFWLAHSSVWSRLCGYREFATSSHMDSILCLEAHRRGLSQHVLPSDMSVFHQEHSDEGRSHRPETHLDAWQTLCEADDRRSDRSKWGLADQSFSEHSVSHPKASTRELFRNPVVLDLG